MYQFVLIIITIILSSCVSPKKNINIEAVFERGHINDSISYKLDYYSYSQVTTKTGTKHIYKLDSTISTNDSHLTDIEKYYHNNHNYYKQIYFQSQCNDTLYYNYYENDSVLKLSEKYELLDSVKINVSNQFITIYKYELSLPPIDGDLTLFFNKEIGLIEKYNRGWNCRINLKNHSIYNNQISTIISKLRRQGDFYYFNFPPPPLPLEYEINN
jgi:hypothetical protein